MLFLKFLQASAVPMCLDMIAPLWPSLPRPQVLPIQMQDRPGHLDHPSLVLCIQGCKVVTIAFCVRLHKTGCPQLQWVAPGRTYLVLGLNLLPPG